MEERERRMGEEGKRMGDKRKGVSRGDTETWVEGELTRNNRRRAFCMKNRIIGEQTV